MFAALFIYWFQFQNKRSRTRKDGQLLKKTAFLNAPIEQVPLSPETAPTEHIRSVNLKTEVLIVSI